MGRVEEVLLRRKEAQTDGYSQTNKRDAREVWKLLQKMEHSQGGSREHNLTINWEAKTAL